MELISNMIRALQGSSASAAIPPAQEALTPPTQFDPAPPLTKYPSSEDAAYARKYGFGYHTGTDPYVNKEVARIYGGPDLQMDPKATDFKTFKYIPFVPKAATGDLDDVTRALVNGRSKNMDLTDPKNSQIKNDLGDVYARSALAANRVPIAALGFDPTRMVADPNHKDEKKVSVYGSYMPDSSDSIYFNRAGGENSASTPVHEAAHRGLFMLRKNPEAYDLLEKMKTSDELIVRYLMATQAGDPEAPIGSIDRIRGLTSFEGSKEANERRKTLDQLTAMAQKEIARRKPGGPN